MLKGRHFLRYIAGCEVLSLVIQKVTFLNLGLNVKYNFSRIVHHKNALNLTNYSKSVVARFSYISGGHHVQVTFLCRILDIPKCVDTWLSGIWCRLIGNYSMDPDYKILSASSIFSQASWLCALDVNGFTY